MLNKRKSLAFTDRRKSSVDVNLEKNRSTTKINETKSVIYDKSETQQSTSTLKKSVVPASINAHRKSDADKSLYPNIQEKASAEPYVHEFKEFAGVTIIFRTAPNPRGFGNFDGHGRLGMQGSRRKSEFHHSQLTMQNKLEHGDKTDHGGAIGPVFSANNSNDTTSNYNHH